MPSDTSATDLGHIDPAIQKVEFKLTVFATEESKLQALLRTPKTPRVLEFFADRLS